MPGTPRARRHHPPWGLGAGEQGCPVGGGRPPELLWPLGRASGPSWLPGGGGRCPLLSFPQAFCTKEVPQARGAGPWVPRAPGPSAPSQRHSLCPTFLPPLVPLPSPGLCQAPRWRTVTHMVTRRSEERVATRGRGMLPRRPRAWQTQDGTPSPLPGALAAVDTGAGGVGSALGFSSPERPGRKSPLKFRGIEITCHEREAGGDARSALPGCGTRPRPPHPTRRPTAPSQGLRPGRRPHP